jgi:hypothetical protein
LKIVTRAAAVLVTAAVLAVAGHTTANASGDGDAAVWCAKQGGQSTNGTCPVQPPTTI